MGADAHSNAITLSWGERITMNQQKQARRIAGMLAIGQSASGVQRHSARRCA